MTLHRRLKPLVCHSLWLCILFSPALLLAQKPATISVDVNVVNVLATVRDKHGHIINNLDKDDFALSVDGHPQTIRYFSRETDLPLTLGLLVDTSLSQRQVIGQERSASYTFLDQMLRQDKDQAFLIHFDRQVELLQDLTSSRGKLQAGLQALTVQQPQLSRRRDDGGGGNDPNDPNDGGQYPRRDGDDRGRRGGMGGFGGGTRLYDAVYLASNELMAKQHGRKALIVLSDGVDIGSKESLVSALEAAQRANTVVYTILFKGEEGGFGGDRGPGGWGRGGGRRGGMGWPGGGGGGWPGGGRGRMPERNRPDGKKIMEQISGETGGRFFEVSKKHPIDEIYKTIQEELRNQYSLGFTPDSVDGATGYHKITLTAKKKDLIVQARDGYYGKQ